MALAPTWHAREESNLRPTAQEKVQRGCDGHSQHPANPCKHSLFSNPITHNLPRFLANHGHFLGPQLASNQQAGKKSLDGSAFNASHLCNTNGNQFKYRRFCRCCSPHRLCVISYFSVILTSIKNCFLQKEKHHPFLIDVFAQSIFSC